MTIHGPKPLLNVESVPRSIEFYRDGLGFRVVHQWEENGRVRFATLEQAGFQLMLNEPQAGVDSRQRPARASYADAVLYFTVDDVDSLHRRLTDAAIAVGDVSDEPYGMREFYVRDPDGYELGFGSPVSGAAGVVR